MTVSSVLLILSVAYQARECAFIAARSRWHVSISPGEYHPAFPGPGTTVPAFPGERLPVRHGNSVPNAGLAIGSKLSEWPTGRQT